MLRFWVFTWNKISVQIIVFFDPHKLFAFEGLILIPAQMQDSMKDDAM